MDCDRRHFLAAAIAGAAGLGASSPSAQTAGGAITPEAGETGGAQSAEQIIARPAHPMRIEPGAKAVCEAPRQTPVAADVDVLVIGGGPAGVGAALAAGRCGAKTLLVERFGMLGGVWTAGLLNPVFDTQRKGWIVAELVRRLEQSAAWRPWKFAATFDTEAMKLLLEQMMAESGVEVWYYTFAADAVVEGRRLRGAVLESKSGREAVLAKVVIDCSGDGDAAARAGVPFRLGRIGDGLCQPMTLMFEIEGVAGYSQRNSEQLYDELSEAIRRDGLDVKLPFARVNYAPWIIHVPRSGAAVVQATHVYRMNGLDTRDLTAATREARCQAAEMVRVMRRVPGLQGVRLTQTAGAIGVREARRLCGRYTLSLDDLRAGRRFDDAVTFGAFGVDIHDVVPGGKQKSLHHTPMRPYEIPYRCLLPEALAGLLFAGRCISGTHEAHASYRVTGTTMAMGQAAGLAGAMAVAEGVSPDALEGARIRQALTARGVGMLPRG